jgi:hypothetical protein
VSTVEQLAFVHLVAEAEAAEHAARDQLRAKVQAWFDRLPRQEKNALATWMHAHAWDTHAALAAAAGDWYQSTRHA